MYLDIDFHMDGVEMNMNLFQIDMLCWCAPFFIIELYTDSTRDSETRQLESYWLYQELPRKNNDM